MKQTKARSAISAFLKEESKPVDVGQILDYLKKKNLSTDTATIYRNLDLFLEEGLINRIDLGEGKFRYEVAGSDHHHFVCERCGSIEDISDCSIGNLEEEIKQKKGLLVKRHSLEFFGLCRACSN